MSCPQVAIKSAEASCGPGLLSAVRFTTAAICFAPSTIRGFADPVVRGAAMELGVYLTGEGACHQWRNLPFPMPRLINQH